VEIAKGILEDRRRRAEIFGRAMFGEPAWELLLTLYVIDHNRKQPTIGRLAHAAHVAMSTAMRWLLYLEGHGLIARQEHPTDARSAMVAMTDKGKQMLATYFSATMTPRL
jgi:DNA-binding MarR family transcriptional regulator